jgi:hypothetical protein
MFRFTIRDVLWLTVVVAIGVGWRCDRNQQAALRDRLVNINTADIQRLTAELERTRQREMALDRQLMMTANENGILTGKK